jgi:hypothetical protein
VIYKNRVVIGSEKNLRTKLVMKAHLSCIDGYVGIQNSYKRLKVMFLQQVFLFMEGVIQQARG